MVWPLNLFIGSWNRQDIYALLHDMGSLFNQWHLTLYKNSSYIYCVFNLHFTFFIHPILSITRTLYVLLLHGCVVYIWLEVTWPLYCGATTVILTSINVHTKRQDNCRNTNVNMQLPKVWFYGQLVWCVGKGQLCLDLLCDKWAIG